MSELYFRVDGRIYKGSVEPAEEGKLALSLPFALKDELKASVRNPRWNPRDKVWMADDCFRTRFVLKFLQGNENVYARYDAPLLDVKPYREKLYAHQTVMMQHKLTRKWAIVAAEMGCVDGEAVVHVNRAGKGFSIPLRTLFRKFHGHADRGKAWDLSIPTYIRSNCDGVLRLNRVVNVLSQGRKKTLRIKTIRGYDLRVTPDHEIATSNTEYRAAELLKIGDTILVNGKWIDQDGYVRVGGLKGKHPRWTTGGVYEHLLVMEEVLGRPVREDEVVHHKNEIRHDNRPENLELLTGQSEHARLHGEKNFVNLDSERCQFIPQEDQILSVSEAEEVAVYDVVCEDPHRNFVANGIIVHNCGKTLSAIETMEHARDMYGTSQWWYIAPKSALESVKYQMRSWNAQVIPMFMTYEEMVRRLTGWTPGEKPPQGVFFDESSRLKNAIAQRTQAAMHLADHIREYYGEEGFIIEMSGSPAPKSPVDWWSQCEVAHPGFLREGSDAKFRERIALMRMEQNMSGIKYPKLITFRDSERKCNLCGKFEDHEIHRMDQFASLTFVPAGEHPDQQPHKFTPMVNEIEIMHKRMNGLVLVMFKKDCFSGSTEVLTRNGPRTLRELAESGEGELLVRTEIGMRWMKVPVKSFGIQRTFPLRFGDGNKVRTTYGHQWLTVSKGEIQRHKKSTYELVEGKTELPLAPITLPEPNREAYARGFVFGDGHIVKRKSGDVTEVPLYGNDIDLLPLLLEFGQLGDQKRKGWEGRIPVVRNLPGDWKDIPEYTDASQALGFVLGVTCADGACDQHLRVYQADHWNLRRIRDLAILAGLRCGPIRLARELSPFDHSDKPLWYFSYQTYNLKREWVLRTDYQEKMSIRGRSSCTTVHEVDWTDGIEEEVFCAQVPRYSNFTLANGVITGNCLDLPEKVYIEEDLKPTQTMLRLAKMIKKSAPSAAQALILLRELSDGFQYSEKLVGTVPCSGCEGKGTQKEWDSEQNKEVETTCIHCAGKKVKKQYETVTVECDTPKVQKLKDILENKEEDGRLIVFAGFTGSIDRVCATVVAQKFGTKKWNWIRVDGRGWSSDLGISDPQRLIEIFQEKRDEYPNVVFVGHPGSAGMGLTLTASDTIVYYSNDFNAESRIQSEDRIHRPGSRGANIIDLCHLPVDKLVIDNLKKKRDLMKITMGDLDKALEEADALGV